jgi:hypothetical protein
MTDTLVMMVALVAAGGWIIYQQLIVNKQAETLEEMDEAHRDFGKYNIRCGKRRYRCLD